MPWQGRQAYTEYQWDALTSPVRWNHHPRYLPNRLIHQRPDAPTPRAATVTISHPQDADGQVGNEFASRTTSASWASNSALRAGAAAAFRVSSRPPLWTSMPSQSSSAAQINSSGVLPAKRHVAMVIPQKSG
jgi:hypothetical protein